MWQGTFVNVRDDVSIAMDKVVLVEAAYTGSLK